MARLGTIDISELNTPPEKHELATAKFFARLGKDIRFIRPSNRKGEHTPDFWMENLAWEIKSPKGKTDRCLADNMRDAIEQSENLIIDLRRMKLPEQKCIRKIKSEIDGKHGFKRILVITRRNKILTIK